MADDDEEDCLLAKDALAEAGLPHQLRWVSDGEELLDYLRHSGSFIQPDAAPRPDLILLDLNMPRRDGRESLRLLKGDPRLQKIPVVVLTTSTAQSDISYSYNVGASSYIAKPASFQGWIELIELLTAYWFKLVELPARKY
ncbi:MAG: response regulator [Pirellulales bacterium]|nr:response regulator [Pirellulales bacterium]